MKLKYIVNIDLNSKVARVVQIRAMANEFYNILGDDFECLVSQKSPFDDKYFEIIKSTSNKKESSLLRKLLFHIGAYKQIKNSSDETVIYSRNLSIVFLAHILGKKSAWELHDNLGKFNSFLLKKINNLTIIAISEALINYYNEYFKEIVKENELNQNIILARSGVYIDNYDKYNASQKRKLILLEQFKLPIDKTIIVHSGSLYEGRGAELFEIILSNFPDILFLQIGGKDKDISKWEKRYSQYLNIKFIPNQINNKLIEYQLCADLSFLPMTKQSPIWQYTSPMKAFEYMASRVPILCSDTGAVSEIINKNNAIIFDSEDENSLIEAIKYFQANQEEAKKLAQKAYQDVKAYDWKNRAKNIIKELE
jgi:glycosyltransferase involved in cell wall biosynthesis